MTDRVFLDTNILVYAFVPADPRAIVSDTLITTGALISIQVLNEFIDVARRKLRRSWDDIEAALDVVHQLCGPPLPITYQVHQQGIDIAKRHDYRIYDALILASALDAGCSTLYSEDMQNGQKVRGLTIRNPFLRQ